MKTIFFGTQPYDRESFDRINADYGIRIKYHRSHLNIDNVPLAQGADAVCIFVNDSADAPTVGELARMLTRLDENEASVDEVRSQPLACARRVHELTGATVLLKGAVTMVVGTDGEGNERVILSGRAPAWMSTAGSGDVLAGMLGALLAQQDDMLAEDPALVPEVVAAGAYIHGLAGAIASRSEQRGWHRPQIYGHSKKQHFGEIGHPIIASDIIGGIQPAFLQLL